MSRKTILAAATITLAALSFTTFSSAAVVVGNRGQAPTVEKPARYDNSQVGARLKRLVVVRAKHRRLKDTIEISCKEGRLIVARQGFDNVHTLKCEGRNFAYTAMLDGELLRVNVNRRGDIVAATRF